MTILLMDRRHFLGLSGSAAIAAWLPEMAFAKLPTQKRCMDYRLLANSNIRQILRISTM